MPKQVGNDFWAEVECFVGFPVEELHFFVWYGGVTAHEVMLSHAFGVVIEACVDDAGVDEVFVYFCSGGRAQG